MKKFLIEWETDFCDDFPEHIDADIIEAENKDEAIEKFNESHTSRALITNIEEM